MHVSRFFLIILKILQFFLKFRKLLFSLYVLFLLRKLITSKSLSFYSNDTPSQIFRNPYKFQSSEVFSYFSENAFKRILY